MLYLYNATKRKSSGHLFVAQYLQYTALPNYVILPQLSISENNIYAFDIYSYFSD